MPLTELRDEPVLLLDDGHCFRDQALAACRRTRARESEFRATSLSTLAQMVAGGGGVTLLPELAVATETTRTPLRVRRLAAPTPHRTIGLVCGTATRSPAHCVKWPPRSAPRIQKSERTRIEQRCRGFPSARRGISRVAILCVVCRAS